MNKEKLWKPYMKKYKRFEEMSPKEKQEFIRRMLKVKPGDFSGKIEVNIVNKEENDEEQI